jgi:hypothetical protein
MEIVPLNHLYTLARINCWPREDGSICDPKYVGVNFTWTFNVFLINIELLVRELVIIETYICYFNVVDKGHPCTCTEALYRPYGP